MSRRSNPNPESTSARTTREESFGWMLKTLGIRLDEAMRHELKPLGLSLGQFAIVMTLLECDKITQTEIGRRVTMPGYAMTRNLDGLEELGLAERRAHRSSRRSHSILLTKKGRALGPELFSIVRRVNERLLSGLSRSECEQLAFLLRKLVKGWPDPEGTMDRR